MEVGCKHPFYGAIQSRIWMTIQLTNPLPLLSAAQLTGAVFRTGAVADLGRPIGFEIGHASALSANRSPATARRLVRRINNLRHVDTGLARCCLHTICMAQLRKATYVAQNGS